ncbi:mucin-5AC isoform X2 [Teleopsis dalmanni]|uniref:mucin-5AC isoform X2 n=1 Tax=Teleopsis dalmanni TaxID=139649 RepID=UPI0018CF48E3|nr:mucin-5AC isoform X2 [Teleopsis dalmanni]
MEHINTSTTIRQLQQHQQLQQHLQEQQQQHEHQQQFCLRWHNHQTSLLSTLPILLDQSHLTDVTISAEGRSLRAHRVVLSACSTFFLELFRTLDTTNHPVIIIPGATFAAIVALLTFMYSGEVNVYEEQIPILLNLAETLGIKGLADVQNNKSSKRQTDYADLLRKEEQCESPLTPPTPPISSNCSTTQIPLAPTPSSHTLATPLLTNKIPTPLESFFLKSLQFYPNLLTQPLNFSQNALNKTTELLAKYQQQCGLYQNALGMPSKDILSNFICDDQTKSINEDTFGIKRIYSGEKKSILPHVQNYTDQQQKDIKRIDKIVENLRSKTPINDSTALTTSLSTQPHLPHNLPQLSIKTTTTSHFDTTPVHSPHSNNKSSIYGAMVAPQHQLQQPPTFAQSTAYAALADNHMKLHPQLDQFGTCNRNDTPNTNKTPEATSSKPDTSPNPSFPEKLTAPTTPSSPQAKSQSNSKLYATCFICHKQLSNQYNLRVHLETHQNVRYACNVCSHVSRSKDALRKHVSYRHPGAPSPCETEARRKRATKLLNTTSPTPSPIPVTTSGTGTNTTSTSSSNTSTNNATFQQVSSELNNDAQLAAAAQLSSAYMFLPNQFHLAAVAAAAAQQQQQQQQNLKIPIENSDIVSIKATTPGITATTSSAIVAPMDFGMTSVTSATAQMTTTPNAAMATDASSSSFQIANVLNIKSEQNPNTQGNANNGTAPNPSSPAI